MTQSADIMSEAKILGQIQTDMFCEGCGYNLFTQAVIRDPHMGILVCRCPECGKFSPAGIATDAANRWKHAMGGWLALIRFLLVAYLLVMALTGMGMLPYLMADALVGIMNWSLKIGAIAPSRDTIVMKEMFRFGVSSLGLGLAAGIVLVVALYHWSRRVYRWALLLPALAMVVACVMWHYAHASHPAKLFVPIQAHSITIDSLLQEDMAYRQLTNEYNRLFTRARAGQDNPELERLKSLMLQRKQELENILSRLIPLASPAANMALMSLLITIGMTGGVFFGRPMTRGILRVFLPARALQPLGMLWFVDGKRPPAPPKM